MLTKTLARLLALPLALGLGATGCFSDEPIILAQATPGTGPMVKYDVWHKPFPEVPLPSDTATRYDPTSPTKRRLNASILAGAANWERETRAELDKLSGWGLLAPISVSFDAPIDPEVVTSPREKFSGNRDLINTGSSRPPSERMVIPEAPVKEVKNANTRTVRTAGPPGIQPTSALKTRTSRSLAPASASK